jgi:hypothetical protein
MAMGLHWLQLSIDLVVQDRGAKGRNVVLRNKYGPPKIVNYSETILCLKKVLPFISCWSVL